MIVLQEDKGEWPLQHYAFTIDEADIELAVTMLRERGVTVDGPYSHEWMPARSIYFADPDGHDLELCAPVNKMGSGTMTKDDMMIQQEKMKKMKDQMSGM